MSYSQQSMSWWRGRPMPWDADTQAIEQERQRFLDEQLAKVNELVVDLTVDPATRYEQHVAAYIETGDELQLNLALEYVR